MIYLIIVVLAIFTIASTFFQIKSLQPKLRKIDKFGLLPNYSFFAPKPIANDYRLVYKIISDTNTDWKEIPMYNQFSLLRIIWNPFKYYNKSFIDTSHFLLTEFDVLEDKKFIQISLHYLSILMVISEYLNKKGLKDVTIRFSIVASGGGSQVKLEKVLFASYYQKI
jgi:hypothetical protein